MSDADRLKRIAKATLSQVGVYFPREKDAGMDGVGDAGMDGVGIVLTFPDNDGVRSAISASLAVLNIWGEGLQGGSVALDNNSAEKLINAGIPHPVLEAAGGRVPAALKRK